MKFEKEYKLWREKVSAFKELSDELKSICGSEAKIEDRFYRDLEFGTGGLRGILGAGTNRMNVFTVGRATQGYSDYLNRHFSSPSVAIAYDSRINSRVFAEKAAEVFSANGISVSIYPHLMPTPSLSYAVRELKCSGGIVITASHNNSSYNGYKVYGADGCQITSEAAQEIQNAINSVDAFTQVKGCVFSEAVSKGNVRFIEESLIDSYIEAVSSLSVLPSDINRSISIVYTPLNGAGISCVPQCLKYNGFDNIIIPPEQEKPDGSFPTCPYPNPEVKEALAVGLKLAEKTGSDLLLATDPDCDRVGAAVKDGEKYTLISGNEMGVLLLDFICRMRLAEGSMPARPVAVKTVVTTPMAEKLAADYGVEIRNVLTGFKYIGEQIGLLEADGEADRFIFGFEESYGYLSGCAVRDKDAVNASLLICEMFSWYRSKGMSLVEALNELYLNYGFYKTKLLSFTFEGSAGFEKMNRLMDELRMNRPYELSGFKVTSSTDYYTENTGLPRSNVIKLCFAEGSAVMRPSGTEPKLKIYLTANSDSAEESQRIISCLEEYFRAWLT